MKGRHDDKTRLESNIRVPSEIEEEIYEIIDERVM